MTFTLYWFDDLGIASGRDFRDLTIGVFPTEADALAAIDSEEAKLLANCKDKFERKRIKTGSWGALPDDGDEA